MNVKITLSGLGGELATVSLYDVTGDDDPNITESIENIVATGIQPGDTLTVREFE